MTQPLYFVPGFMCNAQLWQNVWPQLSAQFNPVHIDFALHHTMGPMLDDIKRKLDLDPVDLVGFSMGGYLSLRYAIDHPFAVKRLVLIGATGHALSEEEQTLRDKILNYVKSNQYTGITRQRMSKFVHPDNLDGQVGDTIRAMDKTLGKETLIAQMESSSHRPSLLEQAKTLDIPVLVVGAEQDQLVERDEIFRLAEHFSHGEVKMIDKCGHMSPLEAPTQLAQIINEFLLNGQSRKIK
ncbi:MAG: alpha/beta hydrolase [Psychrosphaera sp.]|nr:alpha/beta hydrolase [Psychrosphaera sp.]